MQVNCLEFACTVFLFFKGYSVGEGDDRSLSAPQGNGYFAVRSGNFGLKPTERVEIPTVEKFYSLVKALVVNGVL